MRRRQPRTIIVHSAALAAVLVAVSGCATAGHVNDPFSSDDADDPVRLIVENRNPADIQVYAVQGGARVSLGRVRSLSTERLRIPPAMIVSGTMSLLAVELPRVSGDLFQSPALAVNPGQTIEWRLETTLATSHLAIRQP